MVDASDLPNQTAFFPIYNPISNLASSFNNNYNDTTRINLEQSYKIP